ncbi:MAG: serine--tRNA ligase [Alphaproteobacteria bacterium]
MHDLKALRDNPQAFDSNWARRGVTAQTPGILKLDEERRAVQTELQKLQSERNDKSAQIGKIKKEGGDAAAIMDAVAAIKTRMGELEEKEKAVAESLNQILSSLPNMLASDVPEGKDEKANVEVRRFGEVKVKKGPDHAEIGEKLGMMDFETAAKISGSRFTILSGGLARLERALAQFMLDTHTSEHGYTEVSGPLLVNDKAMYGTGQLPKFESDLYKVSLLDNKKTQVFLDEELKKVSSPNDELKYTLSKVYDIIQQSEILNRYWLVPTSEVSLTNIVADMIVEDESLPRRYTSFTPCFRSEAGAAGKDTRGMLRQHQFYKVEMVSIVKPEESEAEHERMTACAETILKKLDLPFRTIVLCAGDTGFGARKTYDIEVWLPGQEAYREISSCSNCGDFQARRMNARTRPKGTKDTRFVHTLNGSGIAVGRALIAVIENYYDLSDGGIVVPEVLRPYMGGVGKILKAP